MLSYKRQTLRKDKEYEEFLWEKVKKRERFYSFEDALKSCRTRIIAEVKKASPSVGLIKEVSPKEQAKLYWEGGAVAISVLTEDKYFKGSLEDLWEVRQECPLPLLRKDFIFDPLQVLEAKVFGADAVLLIVRALEQRVLEELINYTKELGMSALVEVFDLREAERALKAGAHIIGINNRDLETLKIDLNLSRALVPKLKELGAKFVVVESGIETREQVLEFENLGADAFLIGTSLMKSQDPVKKLRELQGFFV